MLAALKPGTIVTIRTEDGSTRTGRVHKIWKPDGWCICSGHPGSSAVVTESNIISIRED